MSTRSLSLASHPLAGRAAASALAEGGSAVDAVIAGFLAAAGALAGVLFSPLQILIAGPGVGARAFDGRPHQPGQGLPRPRGVVDGQKVPPGAYVAVPGSLGALSLAHAHDGLLSFGRLASYGVLEAQGEEKSLRAQALRRVGALGAAALRDPLVMRGLLSVAGRAEGGLVTQEDLEFMAPVSALPKQLQLGPAGPSRPAPASRPEEPGDDEASGDGDSRAAGPASDEGRVALVVPWEKGEGTDRPFEVILAGDGRGVLAALCYVPDEQGVVLPELELRAPRDAIVVRRGVTRVRPGEVLGGPGPIAVALEAKIPLFACGFMADRSPSLHLLQDAWADASLSTSAVMQAMRDRLGARQGYAVARTPSAIQVLMGAVTV